MADDLLKELTEKRDELRARPTLSGKQPKVCSDEALESLARFRPKTKKELLYVPGLGKAFEEKYGDEFIEILSKYHAAQVKNREVMQPHIKARLEALEARLVNINRRNRLLYMPKLSAKYAVDLVGSGSGSLAGFKVVELLKKQDGKQQLKILDLKEVAKNRIKEAEKRYTEFKTLARESERARRESGESTLHVGYPFVQGKLSGEDFAVRAPLVLFPAKLTLTPDAVYLSLETEKDVVFNSALILAQYKFAGKSDAVDNNTVEEVRPYKFLDDIVEYFKAHDMTLKKPVGSDVTPFVSYTADAFPKYRRGQLEICENAVIGSFSLYSGALQQDFRRIIESDSINEQLNELLVSADEKDIYSDSEQLGDMPDITPPTEKSLNYINELNISQENAIYNINNSQRLVVQGPPGTGKTEFCHWLAKKLERPLIMKKASDLLNCYVGGTEHNIAAAFEEAKRENAVLLFDEIDSFLQDRRTANHSWEVTQVNEFLTQMESYEGYLVATTNLLDLMDNACLRRFDLKAKLEYMTDDQAEEMYRRLAQKWKFSVGNEVNNLRKIRNLSPGDFAAIDRRLRFTKAVSGEKIVDMLKVETQLKEGQMSSSRRTIGFLDN